MAREIDLDQKLSNEDREYLYQRNRWKDVLANYERFGGDPPIVPEGVPLTGPASLVNAAGLDAVTPEEQRKYQEAANQGDGGDDADVDYESMTKAELQTELDSRKADAQTDEERANLDWKAGDNKEALIARLDKDDELVNQRP